ncbi:hypothetical protein WJX82_003576 [Trebouxia sp. C0006]
MDDMVNAPRRTEKSSDSLRKLLGRQIVVPAKTVGLSDAEQSLQGKVVDTNHEENSLWCTVSGDKRWYSWHVDEVTSWLVEQTDTVGKSVSMPVMSARRITKQTSNGLLQSTSGRPQPPHTAGAKSKPRAPGSEHLWKYCKRCNTWKERPGDFSKNHRTPDGLQFYCRFCHNRMTKFNQQRRLEEQHIAEKHTAKKHTAKPATAKYSPFSNAGVSPASKSFSPPFDVIGSKIPRQQRTHATYRKDSDPLPSAERSQTVSPARSPTGRRTHTAHAPAESTVGSDNGKSKQGPLGSSKKSGHRAASIASRPKLSTGPTARPEAQEQASPELQQAASDPAAAPSPKAALKVISRARSSPPGQLALSVAEGNPEGAPATGKGELDPWSCPTGQPWARKASSVEPSNAEPLPKKRKLSSSAADNTTLATSSPVERSAAVAAASKLDGSSAYGLQSRLKPQDLHAEKRTSSPAAPSLSALPTEDPSVPFSSTPMPSAAPMLPLTAAGIFSSTGDVFSAYASLSNVLSPQKLQEFLVTLTKPGQGDLRSQVAAELNKHMPGAKHNFPLPHESGPQQHGQPTAGPGMAGGVKHTGLSLGSLNSFTPELPGSASASTAPGPVNAALELSLLLTTLQSLANLPEEGSQPHNTIASSSHLAQAQLRDWLAQLQQHAAMPANEPSAAQQAEEDAAIAGQVRGEMWGNLQGILSMLAGQGCSPHVQDMLHQIAVHFANEQSQSVALERRLTGNIAKEKEAQKRTQQQLQGGIQVLTAVQRVLGAVRMQQQRDTSRPSSGPIDSGELARPSKAQRVLEAERGERAAQQAVKALQKKEAGWEAELGATQMKNNQLHKRVSELLQEKTALEGQSKQYLREKDTLHTRYTAGVGMIVVHVEVSLSENVPNVMIDCSTSWQSDENTAWMLLITNRVRRNEVG